jgi:hypothetical protein
MLPFIAAGAVALGAAALAFFLDRDTEEERMMHEELRRRNAGVRERFDASAAAFAAERAARRKKAALEAAENMREYCIRYERRLDGPAQEFRTLAARLKSDLAERSISPYRRNALRLLEARLEATRNRLEAFLLYCEWYRGELDWMIRKGQYDALLRFAEPASRLPEDWYYHGKVGLVGVAEVTGGKNAYGQQLDLQTERLGEVYSDTRQRAFMMEYPDQEAIPVQLFASKNRRYFKACLLRGALYVDHILEQLPCKAFVVRYYASPIHGDGYEVRCYPGFCDVSKEQSQNSGVPAFLPRAESAFPGKRYLIGERIDVHLHYHDLLLSSKDLTVTQQPDSLALGSNGVAPIFMYADPAIGDLHPLRRELDSGAAWQLRATTERSDGLLVTLQLGPWRVEAEMRKDESQLCVMALERTGFDSVELDELPYPVRLIEKRFKDSVFCDGLRFNEFVQFCRQQALFGADVEERRKAGQFFERWNQVIDYLLEEEGYQTFTLLPQAEPSDNEWICASTVDLQEVLQDLIDKSLSEPRLFIEELHLHHSGQRRWLQVGELSGVPEALGNGTYCLSHNGIERPNAYGYVPVLDEPLRLRYPNGRELANLGRQKRTLQAFTGGRLLNKALQQVLMMPERYTPQPDPRWSERVRAGLCWENPDWQGPEQAAIAKRVIEDALVESNLYLIQGPPGTGKTTCIVELLHQLLTVDPDMRILVVSQQNTAVDNALDRFVHRYPDRRANILRIGNDPTKVHDTLRPNLTEAILTEYLSGRQREYSRSSIEEPARAAWIRDWIESVYRTDQEGKLRPDDELTELLVGNYRLVGATCVGLASRRYGMDRLAFDLCIVDEGGRSTVPELLIPLIRCRKAILIGDHYQLPPSVASRLREDDAIEAMPFLEETFLKKSFFEQLYDNLPQTCRGRLMEQYRMVEPIGDLVAELFYSQEGTRGLLNGRVHDRSNFLDPEHPLRWHNVDGKQEKEDGDGHSMFNAAEADAILHFLRVAVPRLTFLKQQQGTKFKKKTVAIITPYGAQKRYILDRLAGAAEKGAGIDEVMLIEVDTVDSFQGSEAHVVLYSTVRTSGSISFLLDRQRLNVACSRARENLVFFGATKFLRAREARSGEILFSAIIDRSKYEHASVGGHARRDPPRRQKHLRPQQRGA